MRAHGIRLLSAALLLLLAPFVRAAEPDRDARALAGVIDKYIEAGWKKAGVQPTETASDAEFLRRVYLDVIGRIPSVKEAREFLADKSEDKRAKLIDRLLEHPRYVTHWTNVWRALLLPEANTSIQVRFSQQGFENWLRKQVASNAGYDKMARELITAPIDGNRGGFDGSNSPSAFYIAKEFKPENLAGATARVFLGVKIECAQCHNHPFASWKREQFWSYAAFFGGLRGRPQGDFVTPDRDQADKREIAIPGTEKVVQAAFLDGKEPDWKVKRNARETLADWMTREDNPYFGRAAANRLWGYFFGTGIIDPVDDMGIADNPPSHPELLGELGKSFAAHKFDLKFLMRSIMLSRAYQLSSARAVKMEEEPKHFARMPLRGMSPEQLFDSIAQATGWTEQGPGNPRAAFLGTGTARAEFLTKFSNNSDKRTEYQTSILQALALMNGRVTADATNVERSEFLAAVIDSPFMDTKARIETLYLGTLSRMPREKELAKLVKFVDEGGAAGEDQKPATQAERDKQYAQALADVFWAILNSGEFILNH